LTFFLVSKKITYPFIMLILTFLFFHNPCHAKEDETTYDISLVKTADIGKKNETHEIDGKKVLAETYTVKDGDHLWQILREKKLLEKRNLMELISTLKKLNSSLGNIDMIRPGDKIIIPLAISPIAGASTSTKEAPMEIVPLEAISDVDLDEYIVRQGDSIIKIVEDRYDIPHKELYNEYLAKLKELNPFIKDLNNVYPGQKIKIPIYSSRVVRMPIKESLPETEPMTVTQKDAIKLIAGQLGEIFTLIGEQWLQTGEHFFPLKTGGQLKLNAVSYPIVDLGSGRRVIVDLYNDLPERMGKLITSNWDNYGIVHLESSDNLKKAFDRIINICEYKKLYSAGEPFVSGGDIPVRIAADWVIEQDQELSSRRKKITVINFCEDDASRTPVIVMNYLESAGIKVVDYPPTAAKNAIVSDELDVMYAKDDVYSSIKTLLDITGQNYSTDVDLPVYQSEKADFNLVVKADFSVKINGVDRIIDLSGLGKDIVNLLQEHQVLVHSVSNKKSSSDILMGVLDFLGIKYEAGDHQFLSANRPETQNIIINIQGIKFRDNNGKDMFATSLKLSRELVLVLNMNGYRVFQLPANFSMTREGL
jgi:hypothetical protein